MGQKHLRPVTLLLERNIKTLSYIYLECGVTTSDNEEFVVCQASDYLHKHGWLLVAIVTRRYGFGQQLPPLLSSPASITTHQSNTTGRMSFLSTQTDSLALFSPNLNCSVSMSHHFPSTTERVSQDTNLMTDFGMCEGLNHWAGSTNGDHQ